VADLPGLTGFARGLVGDLDGVAAGLTLRWRSDGTRGAVNRIEEIKELRLVTDLGGRPLGLALALPGPSPRPAPSPCFHRIIRTCARQGVPVPFLADLAYQGAGPSAVRGAFGRIRVINRRLPAGRRAGHSVVRPRR
jgi:hypothetical protein